MKRKLYLVVVAISIAAIVLTIGFSGCKATTPTEETTGVVEEETVEEGAETTEAPTPKEIVWYLEQTESEPGAENARQMVEAYKKIHPEITIKINYTGWDNLTKYMSASAAGEVVDLIGNINSSLKAALLLTGKAYDLTDALNTPNFEGDKIWKDTFIEGTLEQYAYEGEIGILPYVVQTNGFFYDKKLWGDNGWTVPKTWDELLSLCETIKTTTDIAPITLDGMIDLYNDMWFYQIMEKLKGPDFLLSAVEDKTGESWADPSVKKTIEMEREIVKYFISGWDAFTWPEGQNLLSTRDAAMILMGSWITQELKPLVPADWEWGSFPVPEISGGVGKITDMESFLIGQVVLKDSKVIPETIDFLKFMTSHEMAEQLVRVWTLSSTVKGISIPPALEGLMEGYHSATALYSPHAGIEENYPDYYKNIYLKNHDNAFKGKITPDEFVEKMKEDTINYWKNK